MATPWRMFVVAATVTAVTVTALSAASGCSRHATPNSAQYTSPPAHPSAGPGIGTVSPPDTAAASAMPRSGAPAGAAAADTNRCPGNALAAVFRAIAASGVHRSGAVGLRGSVALSVGKIAADLGCEAAEPSGPVPAAEVGVRRVPVPAGGDRRGGPVVPTVQPVLSGH